MKWVSFLFYLEYIRPKTKAGPRRIVEKWVGGGGPILEGPKYFFYIL